MIRDLPPSQIPESLPAPSGDVAPAARLDELASITGRLAELGTQITTLSDRRKLLVTDLAHEGYSHARIAAAAGLSRGRVFQLLESARTGGAQ